MKWIADHRKGILGLVAALGAGCAALSAATGLGPVPKYAGIIAAVIAGLGVYPVRNGPKPDEAPPARVTPGAG